MERKIYFNTQYIILTDCKNTKFSEENYICLNKSDVLIALSKIEKGEAESIVLYNENFNDLFEMVKSHFRYIEAAGGLVKNNENEYLCMLRLGVWDLPKGKLDKGETPEIAAVREVQEETGLMQVQLTSYICSTWHTYEHKKGIVLKQTYWYHMLAPKNQPIAPQTEENITELRWVSNKELSEVYTNTYPSIIDVIKSL
jgi:8-oxo-dGTP pyrophosphatase MutT (NUDIX family)